MMLIRLANKKQDTRPGICFYCLAKGTQDGFENVGAYSHFNLIS